MALPPSALLVFLSCLLIPTAHAGRELALDNPVVPRGYINPKFTHGSYPSPDVGDGDWTHVGVDIAADCGSDVYAFADGEVVRAIKDEGDKRFNKGLGFAVLIKHPAEVNQWTSRLFYTLYLHLQGPPLKVEGDNVVGGQSVIGKVGNTGTKDQGTDRGCHTHFEVRYFEGVEGFWHPEWGELTASGIKPNIYGRGNLTHSRLLTKAWEDPELLFGGIPEGTNFVELARKAAKKGFAWGQYLLGLAYLGFRSGIPRDDAEAIKWFRKAAEQGHVDAQSDLAFSLSDLGPDKRFHDYMEARKWYRKAAEQGDDYAQLSLGAMYATGKGGPKDSSEAAKWYRMAAEPGTSDRARRIPQGNSRAQYLLAELYANGQGLPQDYSQAAKWYGMAARAEPAEQLAWLPLARLYAQGRGVPQDYAEAAKWYRKVAEIGGGGITREEMLEAQQALKTISSGTEKHLLKDIEATARNAILIDVTANAVLLEKNADKPLAPGSMSKIMTVYMIFKALKEGVISLNDTFTVSKKAWRRGGSKMFVLAGTKVRVEDLLRGVIVQSANDAAIALAEGLSGSEGAFAEQMNRTARALGLTRSSFTNATGWPDPNHRMTARDLATLALHTIQDFPEYYHYYSETQFTWNGIRQGNRNPLLYQNLGADGLMTSYTEKAGFGLTGSAIRDGRRVILVLNGLKSARERSEEANRLVERGFSIPLTLLKKEKQRREAEAKRWKEAEEKRRHQAQRKREELCLPGKQQTNIRYLVPEHTEDAGEKILSNTIFCQSKDLIRLLLYKKTDGQSREISGVQVYRLMYEAEIEFLKDVWWSAGKGFGPNFGAFERTPKNSGNFYIEINNYKKNAGDKQKLYGVILFEKTERGWWGQPGKVRLTR